MSKAHRGSGSKAYRRAAGRLKRKVGAEGLRCAWCHEPIDTTLPHTDEMSFSADHPIAVANGGALVGQVLEPMHRRCNRAKGNSVVIDLNEWDAT